MTTPARGNLGRWLLAAEATGRESPAALAEAAERVCQKLYVQVARLVALEGSRALFTRALFLARPAYPFLADVYVDHAPEELLGGLRENVQGIEPERVNAGLAEVVSGVIELLETFIGEDLTVRLVREPWPDAPFDASETISRDL